MSSTTVGHLVLVAAAIAAVSVPAAAQRNAQGPMPLPVEETAIDPAPLDEEWSHWTGGRYRITPGDVLEFTFAFVPELNQTVAVQPDGYLTLRDIPDIRAQGRTVEQIKAEVTSAYAAFVRDPALTITLKEFEKPYFVASGAVEKPGRYELRGATTLTQALAVAGGPTLGANMSRVVLMRRYGAEPLEARQINVSRMFARRDLAEDPLLRPGDMILVPKGPFGKLYPLLEVLPWR